MKTIRSLCIALLALAACSETPGAKGDAGEAPGPVDEGRAATLTVPASGRAYLDLAAGAAGTEAKWDLAFDGYSLFTNGGASGSGKAAAFGPLDMDGTTFLAGTAPEVPFLVDDKPSGAFDGWYLYEGAPSHVLWSRFHVYVVKDGATFYKVQVLGYYGDRNGEPVSALYTLRWQALGDPNAKVQELTGLDGTAGGTAGGPTAPSDCVDLTTGTHKLVTPADAAASNDWHVCLRRTVLTVNGGRSGPRGLTACDVNAAEAASETLEATKAKTAASELARFESVTAATAASCALRSEGVASAFAGLWATPASNTPSPSSWLVRGADGAHSYLVVFRSFEGSTEATPGTIQLGIKSL